MSHYVIHHGLQRSRLFISSMYSYRVLMNNVYLKNENYVSLQRKLQDYRDEESIHSDIYDLPSKLNKQYDSIYLSNIINYQKDKDKYYQLILTLYQEFLKENGSIYYGYFYGDVPKELKEGLPNTNKLKIGNAKGLDNHYDYVYQLKKNS